MTMATDRDADAWIDLAPRPTARDRRVREAELSAARKRTAKPSRVIVATSRMVEPTVNVRERTHLLETLARSDRDHAVAEGDANAQAFARFAALAYKRTRTTAEHMELRKLESQLARAGAFART